MNVDALLQYWQTSSATLADFEQPIVKITEISKQECNEGKILSPAIEDIFNKQTNKHDLVHKDLVTELEQSIHHKQKVIIAPITLIKPSISNANSIAEQQEHQLYLPVLCLYAEITSNGQILANNTLPLPWVPRVLLEPTVKFDFCLGNAEKFDHYYNYSPPTWGSDGPTSWQEQLEYCYNFFYDTTENSWQNIVNKLGYDILSTVTIFACKESLAANAEQITKVAKKTKIWEKVFVEDNFINKESSIDTSEIYQTSFLHFGHIINKYALSMQQRHALMQMLNLSANEILYIQASPGTGKSTIIHDFIATKWIAAILADEAPPKVACIDKNSEVKRLTILDCLAEGSSWLPKAQWHGCLQDELNSSLSKSASIINFLAQCSKEFGKPIDNLAAAKNALRDRLQLLQENLTQGIDAACVYHAITKQIQLSYKLYGGIVRRNKDIKEASDKQISYLHYLEVFQSLFKKQTATTSTWKKWLENIPPIKSKKTNKARMFFTKHLPDEDVENYSIPEMEEYLQTLLLKAKQKSHALTDLLMQIEADAKQFNLAKLRAKRLIPEVIEEDFDLAQLMKFFDKHLRYRIFLTAVHYWEAEFLQKFNWEPSEILQEHYSNSTIPVTALIDNPVDWLIVENSEYLSPAAGFYCVEGSNNLIVMADRDVISFSRIPSIIDEFLLANANLLTNENSLYNLEDLQFKGITIANGQFSKICETITNYKEKELYLHKQFDTSARLIECQNEFAQVTKLKPCKKSKVNFIEDISYLPVPGIKTEFLGSYKNDDEIHAIINWLKIHEAAILARYPEHSLTETILICTTFYGQVVALREGFASYNLDINNIELIQTAHKKRAPIVIFSPVYTNTDKGNLCFDHGEQILRNLLLTAKDHLLVFGDKEIFNQNLHSASGKFAKHLFASKKNELIEEYEEHSIL